MKPFVIKNEQQYEEALAYVATLMDAPPGSAQEAELELWGTLVEVYEDKVHPIGLPDPIEAIKFRMDQAGLTPRDLIPYLGSPSKVSEVLSRKRPLSLAMMRRLHEGLGIPAASLLGKSSGIPRQSSEVSRHGIRPTTDRSLSRICRQSSDGSAESIDPGLPRFSGSSTTGPSCSTTACPGVTPCRSRPCRAVVSE